MRKNRCPKVLTGILALCTVFHLSVVDCRAAEPEEYTYTLTISAGNHGTFSSTDVVTVENGAGTVTGAGTDKIVVSNLPYNARVSIDAAADGMVNLGVQSKKYYVKGTRESGRDESQPSMQSLTVTSDLDYVVAYGIQGDMTSYTVHYQNEAGSTLLPSRTYRGNVGDRPVVAYRYVEGYQPQAYNITRALVKNEAENVFTFVYTPVAAGGGGGGGTTEEEGGGTAAPAAPAAPEGTPAAPGAAPAAPPAAAGGGAGAGGGAADAVPGGGEAPVEVPDEEVPQDEGPEELQDVGDEEVPLAEPGNEMRALGFRNMMGAAAIAGVGSLALMALIVLWVKRRRMQAAAADQEDEEE